MNRKQLREAIKRQIQSVLKQNVYFDQHGVSKLNTPIQKRKQYPVGLKFNLKKKNLKGVNQQLANSLIRVIQQNGQLFFITNASNPIFNQTITIKPYNDVSGYGQFDVPHNLVQSSINQNKKQDKYKSMIKQEIDIIFNQGQQQKPQDNKYRKKLISYVKKYDQSSKKMKHLTQKLSDVMDIVKQFQDQSKKHQRIFANLENNMQRLGVSMQIVDDYIVQVKQYVKKYKRPTPTYKDLYQTVYNQVDVSIKQVMDELKRQQLQMKDKAKKAVIYVRKMQQGQDSLSVKQSKVKDVFNKILNKIARSALRLINPIKNFNKMVRQLPPIIK